MWPCGWGGSPAEGSGFSLHNPTNTGCPQGLYDIGYMYGKYVASDTGRSRVARLGNVSIHSTVSHIV